MYVGETKRIQLCTVVSVNARNELFCVYRYMLSESVSSQDRFTVISLLHISHLHSQDLTTYNCTAVNDHGAASVIIALHQRGLSVCLSVTFFRESEGTCFHRRRFVCVSVCDHDN